MHPSVIDVVGPSFHNHGDRLMALVIEQELGSDYRLAIEGRSPVLFQQLLNPLYRNTPTALKLRRWKYYAAAVLPQIVRTTLQAPKYSEIRAVLDCSGFQYGDQWKDLVATNQWRIDHYRKLKHGGKRVIMLPQAFGPFKNQTVKEIIKRLLENTDLIFARDSYSYEHLVDLGFENPRVRLCPDFSILAQPIPPKNLSEWQNCVCIVPNSRMLDMTGDEIGSNYIPFLQSCVRQVHNLNLRPVLVLHEKYDYKLALLLSQKVQIELPIISRDALATKGVLGSCFGVISSRYHALIGALSQGVPAIGTGWSHKYKGLFEDYECPECLLESLSEDDLREKITYLTDNRIRQALVEKIRSKAALNKEKVNRMWQEIKGILQKS